MTPQLSSWVGICPTSIRQASSEPDPEVGSVRGTAAAEIALVSARMLLTVQRRRGKFPDSDSSQWLRLGSGKPRQSDEGCEGEAQGRLGLDL